MIRDNYDIEKIRKIKMNFRYIFDFYEYTYNRGIKKIFKNFRGVIRWRVLKKIMFFLKLLRE